MIHYHGTPLGGPRIDGVRFFRGRHALVPYPRPEDLPIVADVAASFILDNGAFSVWRQGGSLDVEGYTRWCEAWAQHPGLDWCLIPDVIEGSAADNDALIRDWPVHLRRLGVPVWHLHEDVARLATLAATWPRVALGSSGAYRSPGSAAWWRRMDEAMRAICDREGRPVTRLHGLRMLDPAIFSRLPLASADSANAAINSGSLSRFGSYLPPTAAQRAATIADRIEAHNSAPVWTGPPDTTLSLEMSA